MGVINNLLNNDSDKVAIIKEKEAYTYKSLYLESQRIALDFHNVNGTNIALLANPGPTYVLLFAGIIRSGNTVVPISPKSSDREIEHILNDSNVSIIFHDEEHDGSIDKFKSKAKKFCYKANTFSNPLEQNFPYKANFEANALILYTSGTSGKPKGVPLTINNIEASIQGMIQSWKWETNDYILNPLPMHHTHGIVNILLCSLVIGATCEFTSPNPAILLNRILNSPANLFMAVPTLYNRLLKELELKKNQQDLKKSFSKFRLMISGSAALPIRVLNQWNELTGHTLLERYGMTEIGMALSNPYEGDRVPGTVGFPLPKVNIRLINESGEIILNDHQSGEIQVKGPNVFTGYLNNLAATQASFTKDNWFKTGDIAIREGGRYKLLGRNSIDIIKSGGYKISALEIENVLKENKTISEIAVVGIPHEDWGEEIIAYVVFNNEQVDLKSWCQELMSAYKIPKQFISIEELPKNSMGKVQKNKLKEISLANKSD